MNFQEAWLIDEPLDIAVVPRTAPPLIDVTGEPGGRAPLTELEVWIGRVVQACVEIVGGDRPITQAVRWMSSPVYAQLNRRTTTLARVGGYAPGVARVQRVRPRVTGVVSSCPSPDVVEAAVVVRTGHLARAVAVQFRLVEDRWLCTVLDFGNSSTEDAMRTSRVSALRGLRDTA